MCLAVSHLVCFIKALLCLPILQFMVFMLEAVLLFSPISSVLRGAGYTTKRQWHWMLQACAVAAALTGFAVITTNKYMAEKQHYTSWHGLLGEHLYVDISWHLKVRSGYIYRPVT